MSKSTARGALGSVLGTIDSAATAISNVFDAGTGGATMLNRYVSTAQEKQKLNAELSLITYEQQAINVAAMEEARQVTEMQAFIDESPAQGAALEASLSRIKAQLEARRNPNQRQALAA